MDHIEGAVADLVKTEHLVNIKVVLNGAFGTHRFDYRTDSTLLKSVGARATISFKLPPTLELVTATSADVSYNIRAVHYAREAKSKPSDVASVAAIPGAVEIIRSQLQNQNRVPLGRSPNVTDLIKPNPLVGYSPCLDVAWSSLGTDAKSSVTLVVHCVLLATGSDLPDY
jgi:hypothetical protein